jgi:hypothetical protein
MDKFLETQNLPRLNHEENLNISITNKEIESVINNSRQRKTLHLKASLVDYTKH